MGENELLAGVLCSVNCTHLVVFWLLDAHTSSRSEAPNFNTTFVFMPESTCKFDKFLVSNWCIVCYTYPCLHHFHHDTQLHVGH